MKILNEHVKIHTDPHRHRCPYCSNKYHQKAELKTHMFSKHLNLQFRCSICNAELKLNERFHKTYSNHVENMHSDLPEEELAEFYQKIKKLRINDLSDELPEIFKDKLLRNNECTQCQVNFSTSKDLINHKLHAHGNENEDEFEELKEGQEAVE